MEESSKNRCGDGAMSDETPKAKTDIDIFEEWANNFNAELKAFLDPAIEALNKAFENMPETIRRHYEEKGRAEK